MQQANLEDKYDDFSEIIEYILEGNNNQVVKMVTDKLLLDKFKKFCYDGSHMMFAYIDNRRRYRRNRSCSRKSRHRTYTVQAGNRE